VRSPGTGSDAAAARLVAMNLALQGADRAAISAQLAAEFASLEDRDALLDEVLARVGR
jgi:hypothetical protein